MEEILQHSQLSIEKSQPGRRGVRFAAVTKHAADYLPADIFAQKCAQIARNKRI